MTDCGTRVQLRPVTRPDIRTLVVAAAGDDHPVLAPTHVADRGGEIVGYASIGGMVLVHCWVNSQRANKFESLRLLRAVEQQAEAAFPGKTLCLPCAHTSPFFKLLPRLGYARLGFSSFNVKDLSALTG